MKKIRIMLCAALLLLAGGCGRSNFPLEYVIPPGDGADFYFSDQQIRPKSGKVTLAAGAGFCSGWTKAAGIEWASPFPTTVPAPSPPA